MKTSIFIRLTSTLAIIAFVVLAFSSCQQAGRKYHRENSFQKSNTIKPYGTQRSGGRCVGGS